MSKFEYVHTALGGIFNTCTVFRLKNDCFLNVNLATWEQYRKVLILKLVQVLVYSYKFRINRSICFYEHSFRIKNHSFYINNSTHFTLLFLTVIIGG